MERLNQALLILSVNLNVIKNCSEFLTGWQANKFRSTDKSK
jgi:hypothetical protein